MSMPGLKEAPAPHYFGHRQRLRDRFRQGGAEAMPDYELMELILFRAIPRRDTKPLAKAIIDRFGGFAEAINAAEERLAEIPGLGAAAITEIKLVRAASLRMMQGELRKRAMNAAGQMRRGADLRRRAAPGGRGGQQPAARAAPVASRHGGALDHQPQWPALAW